MLCGMLHSRSRLGLCVSCGHISGHPLRLKSNARTICPKSLLHTKDMNYPNRRPFQIKAKWPCLFSAVKNLHDPLTLPSWDTDSLVVHISSPETCLSPGLITPRDRDGMFRDSLAPRLVSVHRGVWNHWGSLYLPSLLLPFQPIMSETLESLTGAGMNTRNGIILNSTSLRCMAMKLGQSSRIPCIDRPPSRGSVLVDTGGSLFAHSRQKSLLGSVYSTPSRSPRRNKPLYRRSSRYHQHVLRSPQSTAHNFFS